MATKRAKVATKTKKPASRTRAKAKLSKPERTQHIYKMMAGGLWIRGVTGVDLAAKWGVTLNTVEHDAAEASRRIKEQFTPEDVADIRPRLVAILESEIADARKTRRGNVVVAAVGKLAEITGANAPVKVEGALSLDSLMCSAFDALDEGDDECETDSNAPPAGS